MLHGEFPVEEQPGCHVSRPVQVHWEGDGVTLAVHGDLDCASAGGLTKELTRAAAERPSRVVIDLADVPFMDCSGLSPIIRARRLLPGDCAVVLRSPSPTVSRLLRITGVDLMCTLDEPGPGAITGGRAVARRWPVTPLRRGLRSLIRAD